jgi:hypothetical protein
MYDLLTSSLLFLILVPGVLVTIPPGGGILAAVVHAIVFFVVQRYIAQFVPWWGVWVVAALAVLLKIFATPAAAPTGGRR